MKNESMNYESPIVEILDVEVEKGFAVSQPQVGSDALNPGEWQNGDTTGW